MKTQLSRFYAGHGSATKTIIALTLIIFIPVAATIYGLAFYELYCLGNLIAVLPALTIPQAIILMLPLALSRFCTYFKQLKTFAGKRKLLNTCLRVFQRHD